MSANNDSIDGCVVRSFESLLNGPSVSLLWFQLLEEQETTRMRWRMLSNDDDDDYKDSVIGMEAQVPEEKLQFIMFQQSLNWRTGNEMGS